jgi:Subtilase family
MRSFRAAAHAVPVLSLALAAAAQSIPDETGLSALIQRVGAGNQPTGAGVVAGMAEAPAPGYLPDPSDPQFIGKLIIPKSNGNGISGHATVVGEHYFGLSTSIAPGIDTIDVWEASSWLGLGFLNGTGSTPPKLADFKIINHSWIGAGADPQKSLRKLDYAIEDQQFLAVVGVNNGIGPLDYPLLAHGFNLIAVGRSDGQHHSGPTGLGIDGPGRQKPELVAPAGATSFATPLVSGAAALMVETARTHPALAGDPMAERADLLKAVLMAGAEHRAGWTNNAPTSGPLRGSTNTPLDALWGADEIDVNLSHWILTGDREPAAPTLPLLLHARHAGWDVTSIASGDSRWLHFTVSAASPRVSVMAAWNRHVALNFGSYELPDLDLELWRVDGVGQLHSLVGDAGLPYFSAGNVQSASPVDNLEHLYLNDLAPGDYALELRRMPDGFDNWNVALAWSLSCAEPIAYGTGKTTSLLTVPQLSWRSYPSIAAAQFSLEVKQAVPNKVGLAFHGVGQASIPFGGGLLLVQPPIERLPALMLDSNGAATIPVPMQAAWAGTTRNFQFWFRDPAHPDGTGVGLSNGVEVVFCD